VANLTRSPTFHRIRTTIDHKRQSSKIINAMIKLCGVRMGTNPATKKYPGTSTHSAMRNQAPSGGSELCVLLPIKYKRHGSEQPTSSE
jgi:hypothetical protein